MLEVTSTGEIPVFSHSQLERYKKCQRLWSYIYHHNRHFGGTKQTKLGSRIHHKLDLILKWMIQYNDGFFAPIPQEILRTLLFPIPQEVIDNPDIAEMERHAATVTFDYHNLAMPSYDKHIKWIASEERLLFPLITPKGRKVLLEMYIDALGINMATDNMFGADHKSGKILSFQEVKWNPQFHLYMYALRALGYPVEEFICNNLSVWTLNNKAKKPVIKGVHERFVRHPGIPYSEDRAREYLDNLGKLIDEILDKQEFYMETDPSCAWCSFNAVCDLHLQGKHDTALELLMSYEEKQRAEDLRAKEHADLQALYVRRREAKQRPVEMGFEFDDD